MFGVLIFIHELGHYTTARIFNVSVTEFSIGMGPKLVSKKSKKTGIAYSVRALPLGGFVSMVGEDEASDDPNALGNKPVWQRIIIVCAGAAMNLIFGFIIMTVLVATSASLVSNVIGLVPEGSVAERGGLEVGDRIIKVDGVSVSTGNELVYEIMWRGTKPIDLVIERNGERITLEDFDFATAEEDGVVFGDIDFKVVAEEKTVLSVAKHAFCRSKMTVKMVWDSLIGLVTGRVGLQQVSGPVGVTEALVSAAQQSIADFIYLAAVISINLGVMNLLPLPALDGGRLVFLVLEAIRRKPIKQELEGYVHFAGIVVLMALMVVIILKDVISLFG